MEFEVSAELVGIYLEDAREHLAALDDVLLRLERSGFDRDACSSILGPLHTLKGNSGMIGFVGIKDYVHRLEDVFTRLRDGTLPCGQGALQVLFEGASALRAAVESAAQGGGEGGDLSAGKATLEALVATASSAAPAVPAPATPPSPWPAPTSSASTSPSSTSSSTSSAS